MRNRHANWAVGVAVLVGAAAWAGHKSYNPVVVTSSSASGSLGNARNSTDTQQYIGCTIYAYTGGTPYVFCFANAASTGYAYVSCSSYDPAIVDAARAINGDSYIQFAFNTSGTCTSLYVLNGSHAEPKKP